MIISISVQPAVAVLPLCVRYPQIPGQISQQQAVQQAHHPGKAAGVLGSLPSCVLWASAPGHRVCQSDLETLHLDEISDRKTQETGFKHVKLCHRHLPTNPNRFETKVSKLHSEKILNVLLEISASHPKHAGLTHTPLLLSSFVGVGAEVVCAHSSGDFLLL